MLEGLEAVRKRPGMYIGSTDARGLMHCVWEIIDNGVDEALAGHADRIEVTLHDDDSVEVHDNGRGIPIDKVKDVGLSGVEVVFTKLHAGGKFGGGSYAVAGGLHGVGASVVNALSARLDVAVERGGAIHSMSFRRGEPGQFAKKRTPSPDDPFTAFTTNSHLEKSGKIAKRRTGTRVRFWPDRQIFPASEVFDFDIITQRARQTSFLVPGLTLSVRDERGEEPVTEEFRHDGGVADFVDYLAHDQALCDTWRLHDTRTFTETVQQLDKNGRLKPKEVERECHVDVALRWGTGFDTTLRSFVNIIATPKGGTHVQGFEQALTKTLRKMIDQRARALKYTAKDPRIEKDDILAGLTAVVTVSLAEPQFEGQTKEVLGTAQVRSCVAQVVEEQLTAYFTSSRRDTKTQALQVLEKVVGEMRARVSARMHKEISRRKNALESSALPAKLADCRTKSVEESELFIVEGDSALGTAKLARSSAFQALLPIRGKILNVQKASATDILKNAECSSIIQVIGAGSGRTFDLDAVRYGKVIIMTDADVDGAHIRTLLLTLFFRYMRPLVEAGRVYAAVPPLFRLDMHATKRKKREARYIYSEAELDAALAQLERSGRGYHEPIQRYKGLGEMDADQLAETTMDPARRTLRRVSIADEAALHHAEEIFALLMGSEVAPRRKFIVAGADNLSARQIDA